MLKMTVHNAGHTTVLRCQGRIVRGDETAILCAALRQSGREVTLDLANVDAIDAAGIGALLSLQAAGIYLKLMNPTDAVRQVLQLTRLQSVFEICDSVSIDPSVVDEVGRSGSPAPILGGRLAVA
jgi:anti-anti-sigma factor